MVTRAHQLQLSIDLKSVCLGSKQEWWDHITGTVHLAEKFHSVALSAASAAFRSGQTYSFNKVQMSLRAFQSVVLLSKSVTLLLPLSTLKYNMTVLAIMYKTDTNKKGLISSCQSFREIYVFCWDESIDFCELVYVAGLYFGMPVVTAELDNFENNIH